MLCCEVLRLLRATISSARLLARTTSLLCRVSVRGYWAMELVLEGTMRGCAPRSFQT